VGQQTYGPLHFDPSPPTPRPPAAGNKPGRGRRSASAATGSTG